MNFQTTSQQQIIMQHALASTKQELKKTKLKLVSNAYHLKRLNETRVIPTSPSAVNESPVFTEIHSQLLNDIPISKNKISQHIGSGTFGTCTLNRYRKFEVSVKYLKESSYQELLNEAKGIKNLEGHPNLPILLGISPKSIKEMYIVTKFHGKNQKGITLLYALRNTKRISPILEEKHFKPICYGIARGLLYIHIEGYIHNDLKTDNVVIDFIDGQPSPVIIDFGKGCKVSAGKKKCIAPEERHEYSQRHSHIAPELANGSHRQGVTSDIYSLGILYSNVAKCMTENEDSTAIASVANK